MTADTELVSLDWLTFDEAQEVKLPNITKVVLKDIAERLKIGQIARPAPFYFYKSGGFHRKLLD